MMPALPAPTIAQDKDRIRQEALARRDALPSEARMAAAEAIAARDFPFPVGPHTVVAGFMPIRSEINPLPLMRKLAEAGAGLALPAIAGRGHPLVFRAFAPDAPLVRGQWGIREPDPALPEVVPDLLLVPLAAFDRRGYRIGYGAGYYDMTLNALRAARPVRALGLAYAVQEVDTVPTEPHDARLDCVLTERETIACGVG